MVRCSRFGPFMGMTLMAAGWGGSAWADESEAAWDSIRPDVVGQQAIEDGAAMIDLVAPKRAEDAALVPVDVRIHMPDGDARTVRAIKLVIDENPAPLA